MIGLALPEEWEAALSSSAERILVLGATDMGKSSFIRALAARRPGLTLVDLDPGQKMVGPPGTASRGSIDAAGAAMLERFVFLGTTSASSLGGTARAAAELIQGAEPVVVNTAGFVHGLGARLQALTIRAVRPDLIVAIGEGLEPILEGFGQTSTLRLPRPQAARSKSPAARAAVRQAAFEEAFQGGESRMLDEVVLEPGPPLPLTQAARPVCSLADEEGEDLALGVVEQAQPLRVFTACTKPVRRVRLGKMWAGPAAGGWRLLEKLSPAWTGR